MKILRDSCYEFVTYKSSFKAAKKHCQDKDGTLVTIKSDAVQQFVLKNLRALRKTSGYVWIGLDDRTTEGTFIWHDNTRMGQFSKLSRIHEALPLFSGLYRDCVAIDVGTGAWLTVNCAYNLATFFDASHYPFVCEYSNRVSHIPTTTLPTTTRCPNIDCQLGCFQHGYVVDAGTGCNTCQCITIPTTTTTTTTPKPTRCPNIDCQLGCFKHGYVLDDTTGCRACQCITIPTTTTTTTTPKPTRCPNIDCQLGCFKHGYVLDDTTGCRTCQCITIPTTTTTTTTPTPTRCPRLNCNISCARYGYKREPILNCPLCECNLN